MDNAATLDSVVINVESDASKASDGLAKLTQQLQNLRDSVKGGFNNLTKLARSLNELKPASDGLSNVASNLKELQSVTDNLKRLSEIETPSGLTNTITRLKELSEVSETLKRTASNVKNVTKMVKPLASLASIPKPLGLGNIVRYLTNLNELGNLDKVVTEVAKLPQIVEPLQSLGNITSGRGMKNVISNLEKLPEVMTKLGDTKTLENIGRVARELVTHLEPLSQEMQRIANGYSAISKMSDTYGVSARTVTRYTKQQQNVFKQLADTIRNTVIGGFKKLGSIGTSTVNTSMKAISKLNSKLKQTGLALIGTRTLFTMLRKAVSEYTAMDEDLQKYTQNVWRAFGAQLAPAIEYAMYLFKQFVRVIYSVVLALTGIDLISRANQKAMAGWGKSAKDTLGNLQKFDDLNVAEFPKSASGSGDDFLIDLQTIDLTPFQKIIDWVKQMRDTIKEALDTGKWYNVGKVFGEGITGGIDFALGKMDMIRNKLFTIADNFGDFLNGALENISWESVGAGLRAVLTTGIDTFTRLFRRINWKRIGKGFEEFTSGLKMSDIVSSAFENLESITKGIEDALHNVNWRIVAIEFGNAIVTGLQGIGSILSSINSEQIGRDIRTILMNIPWGEIFQEIINIFISIFSEFGSFISGLTGIDAISNLMYDIENASINIDWDSLSTSLSNLYKSIVPFTQKTASGLSWFYENVLIPFAEYVVNDSLPVFIDTLSGAIDVFNVIMDAARPSVQFMWDSFLNPLLKITKMAIIDMLKSLNDKFEKFSTWAKENQSTVELMVDTLLAFLEGLTLYLIIKKLPTMVLALGTAFTTFKGAILLFNPQMAITVGAFAALAYSIIEIGKHWGDMNGIERLVSVLGGIAVAATTAAIAIGGLQSAWTLGLGAAAIVAGIASITWAIQSANKRAKENAMALGQGLGGGGFRGYETGGYPEKGQYFYARENGIPEFVGSIGSQVAVANNNQIVDAVSGGVEQAMMRVMQSNDTTTPINIYIGNDKIYSAQQSFNKFQQNKYGTIDLY